MVRYAYEVCPNKEYARVHLSVKVPRMPNWSSDKDSTPEGRKVKAAIEAIEGIEEASSHGQCVRFRRGGAFTFDELFPKVLAVLKAELQLGDSLEEVPAYA